MRWIGFLALFWAPFGLAAPNSVKVNAEGVTIIEADGRQYYTGLKHKPAEFAGLGETHVTLADCEDLPDEFDLRDLGVVPGIRNQGSCGSCWAFSLTASLESAKAAEGANRSTMDLSEQQLVSCDRGSYGCGGGYMNGFRYQINSGQSNETDFPYTATNQSCRGNLPVVAKGVSYANVGTNGRRATAAQVQCALFKTHTIPWVTVSANNWGSMSRDSDALHTNCYNSTTNHAVGLVGWKKVGGQVYFKMRNSWGTEWGSDAGRPGSEMGYAMMKLGCDSLGAEVAYIVSENMVCKPPLVKLPAEITSNRGEETRLAVRAETGVEYEWFQGERKIGSGPSLDVTPQDSDVFKIVAKNDCGTAESSVRLKPLSF